MFIFDIDGVLADVTHLLYLITGENKDFDAYYSRIGEALPLWHGLSILYGLNRQLYGLNRQAFLTQGAIYFVTGRSELSRNDTLEWLQRHGACGERPNLHMRSNTDRRPAHEVKHDIIQRISKETGVPFTDMVVFEDDPQCAKMYESLGCYVCHVRHEKAKS
jgi:hypothetical protein